MSTTAAAPTTSPASIPASAPGSSNRHSLNIIAVSFVVEGSLAISSTWNNYLLQYISPIMKTIQETVPVSPGAQVTLMISFVTYGLRDTHPSPIITKRFFSPIRPSIIAEMRESPSSLGYGKTPYPDADGTSALEGLVIAIEMFNTLHSNYKPDVNISSYIVHVASGSPDDSLHPIHNSDPELDSVTWETLPNELKKRNIQYCAILQNSVQRFVDIHAAIPGPRARLPFSVKPPDVVLPPSLSSMSSPSPIKRMAPNQASPSEIKRSKTERPGDNLSSPLTHAAPPVVHHPTFPTANNGNNNNNASNPSVPPPVLSDPVKNSIAQKAQQLLSTLKQLRSERNVAVVAGNTTRVGQIDQEIETRVAQVKQMQMLLTGQPTHSGAPPPGSQQQQPPPLLSAPSSSVQDVKTPVHANVGPASAPAAAVAPPATAPKAPLPSNNSNASASNPAARPPTLTQAASNSNPAASTSSLSTPSSLPTWDKDIGDHMQNVVNSVANLQRVSVVPPKIQSTAQPTAQMLPPQAPGNPTAPAPQPPTSMPPAPGQANATPPGQKKWRGLLLLSISDSAARNQVTIEVTSLQDHDCSNWSTHMLVRPVPQIRPQVLQSLVFNRTVMTLLAPDHRQANPQANIEAFLTFQRLLMGKNLMAIGVWPRSNSQGEKRAILMPRGNGLVMFVFHHGPMPEIDLRSSANPIPVPSASAQQQPPSSMPGAHGSSSASQQQPSTSSPSIGNTNPLGLTAAQMQKLRTIPNDQRQKIIERVLQSRASGGDPASMQGNLGNAAALAAFTQRQILPPAAGGGTGGLSATEIMQQFMQRGQGDGAA